MSVAKFKLVLSRRAHIVYDGEGGQEAGRCRGMMRQQGDGWVTFNLGGVKMAAKTFDTLAPSLGSHAQASGFQTTKGFMRR